VTRHGSTALLFEAGKFLIGPYIGKQGLESTYGGAAREGFAPTRRGLMLVSAGRGTRSDIFPARYRRDIGDRLIAGEYERVRQLGLLDPLKTENGNAGDRVSRPSRCPGPAGVRP
jgi:hypothetical protein